MNNLIVAQQKIDQQLNRQAARGLSMKNNALAIVDLAVGAQTDQSAIDEIILLALAISFDAEDLRAGLDCAANTNADIHTLRIAKNA